MTELVYINGELFHAEDLSNDALAHYGVPGMKWGKRRGNPNYVSRNTKRFEKDAEKYERKAAKAKLKFRQRSHASDAKGAREMAELSRINDKRRSVGLSKAEKKQFKSMKKNVSVETVLYNQGKQSKASFNGALITLGLSYAASSPATQRALSKGGRVAVKNGRAVVNTILKNIPNNIDGRVINENGRRVYRTAKKFGGAVRLVEPMALPAARKAIGR